MKNIINLINKIDNMEDMNIVIDALRTKRANLRTELARVARTKFSAGDKVVIRSRKGTLKGVIEKVNRTKAVVEIDDRSYNVPLSIMEVA